MPEALLDPAEAVNWNRLEDPLDLEVWTRLTNNFWLDTVIPLSNDVVSWNALTDDERLTVMRVFTGLTLLDTAQGTVGVIEMMPDARTQHEQAVLSFIAGMEAIHAKSYSSIFSTLATTREIDEAFHWSKTNVHLQEKAAIILKHYRGDDPLVKKIISVLLESFLFYSGFALPFWLSARGKLTNTADVIRLILRDEVVHGFYIGHKFKLGFEEQDAKRQDDLRTLAYELLSELYENEVHYARDLYDHLGLTETVLPYMRYNANKALSNLGFDPLFPADECEVSAEILSSLDPGGGENHDFFSGSGSTYVIARPEQTTDDDWDFD